MKDLNQQTLQEGDPVLVPIGLGQQGIGKIIKINSGLGAPNTMESIPSVLVQVELFVPAQPNGVVGGVTKMMPPPPPEITT
jgi:hypothetical protein